MNIKLMRYHDVAEHLLKYTLGLLIIGGVLLIPVQLKAQGQTVSGGVTSAEDGSALPGVNVVVKGTNTGTSTNAEGQYELTVPSLNDTLLVSFVGYETLEVPVNGRTEIDISLVTEAYSGDEVIVVGYGTQRRSELTSSISSISGQDIVEQPVYNIEQSLQGLASGVQVTTNNYRPGSGAQIRIRGTRSLVASNDPLIVLDGIPIEGALSDINTRNIESIEILKDASATAIYGSRGANGVILITTKRGSEGRTTVEYSGFAGIQYIANKVEMMNGEQYAEMRRQDYTVQGMSDEEIFEDWELRALEEGISTDWQDLVWQRGFKQDHQLAISGGDNQTRYYVSGGLLEHEAIAPNNDYTRYSGQINLDRNVTDWLRIELTTQISRNIRHQAGSMTRTYRINPLATPYDEEGNLEFYPSGDVLQENPLFDYDRNNYEDRRERTRLIGNLTANVNISNNFAYRLTFSPDWSFRNYGRFRGSNTIARDQGTSDAWVRNWSIASYILDNLIEYNQTLGGRHNITATLLHSMQTYSSDYRSIEVEDLPYEHQRFYNLGTAGQVNDQASSLTEWALESYMARLNYNFDDRYLVTVTGRIDGSSRLAEGNKFGLFPSAAIAWNIMNESFMQDQYFFDNLRLRISYGKSGNTAISPYQTQGSLNRAPYSFGNESVLGFQPGGIANPDLRWESTTEANIGLEFAILDNRFNVDLNAYRSNTQDLLMNRALPSSSGFSGVIENIGATRNTGFETTLSIDNIRTERFHWTTNFNFSTNRNEIVELYGGQQDDPGNQWFIGHPIDVYFDYKFGGIWQLDQVDEAAQFGSEPGMIRRADVDVDGQITDKDRVILGSIYPKWEAGMTNRIFYRGIDFSAQIYTVQGVTLQSGAYGSSQVPLAGRHNSRNVDFWTPDNPSNNWPQPRYPTHSPHINIKRYVSGDYVRVRNMTLGYQLPVSTIESLNIASARIYASVENPFTFTSFEGADPEAATGMSFPNARTFLLGFDLSL